MMLFAAGICLAACSPLEHEVQLPLDAEMFIFFESGIDRAPVAGVLVPCIGAQVCLEHGGGRVALVRVEDGWRGVMEERPLALFDNGSGLWGGTLVEAVRVTWLLPPTR